MNDGKSILNSMLYYAVELERVDSNLLKEVNCRQYKYKTINEENSVYTLEDLELLTMNDDMTFNFCSPNEVSHIKEIHHMVFVIYL